MYARDDAVTTGIVQKAITISFFLTIGGSIYRGCRDADPVETVEYFVDDLIAKGDDPWCWVHRVERAVYWLDLLVRGFEGLKGENGAEMRMVL